MVHFVCYYREAISLQLLLHRFLPSAAELLKTSIATKKKLNDAYWLHQRELHAYNESVKEKGRLRQAGQLKLGCGRKEISRYVSPFATGTCV